MIDRFTISLDADLAKQFDAFLRAKGYANRSEGLRDLIREHLEKERLSTEKKGHCVATLSYIYNHHQLHLAERLAELHHGQHNLTLATQHVHLDHDACLETLMLRGPVSAVAALAERIIAERGVRHGKLHMIPVRIHKGNAQGCEHDHAEPLT